MSIASALPQLATPKVASLSAPAPIPQSAPSSHPAWLMPLSTYQRIAESGLLSEFRHVYLWEGRLCERIAIDRPHVIGVKSVFLALYELRIVGYEAETETPMALRKAASAPEPDVKVVRGRSKDYDPQMPTSADVPVVVEVADSSLSKDRNMAVTYATEEIPIYWLLNLQSNHLEVYSEAMDGVYTKVQFLGPDDDVPVILDGREMGRIRVADLLP